MARINIYTDESRTCGDRHMLIGGLWVPDTVEGVVRAEIARWRARHNMNREMKWTKISNAKIEEYKAFVRILFNHPQVCFNCIVVDTTIVDHSAHSDGDGELGFYKFYFLLLSRRIVPSNDYVIFTDYRCNRQGSRLTDLGRCVNRWCANNRTRGTWPVLDIKGCESNREDFVQLADVVLGAVGYRCNGRCESPPKVGVIESIEASLGRKLDVASKPYERKFNVWRWRPECVKKGAP